jgi:hypothetical protein
MSRSIRTPWLRRGLAVSATALLVTTGSVARADELGVTGEVIVPKKTTRTETTVETRTTTAPSSEDSAYGEPIEDKYLTAEREAFAYEHAPNKAVGAGESIAGIFLNSFFFPVKLVVGTAGAVLGGVAGATSGGDERAASQIWNVTTDGSYFMTPERMEGRQRYHLTGSHP